MVLAPERTFEVFDMMNRGLPTGRAAVGGSQFLDRREGGTPTPGPTPPAPPAFSPFDLPLLAWYAARFAADVTLTAGSATVTCTQANAALDSVTVGVTVLVEGTDFARGANDDACATALAAAVDAIPGFGASATLNVVTITNDSTAKDATSEAILTTNDATAFALAGTGYVAADGKFYAEMLIADHGPAGADPTSTVKPLYIHSVLNGLPSVFYTGDVVTNPHLQLANWSSETTFEVWIVRRAVSVAGFPGMYDFGTSASTNHWKHGTVIFDDFGRADRPDKGAPADLTQWRIIGNTAQTGDWKTWIDGGSPLYSSASGTYGVTATPMLGRGRAGISSSPEYGYQPEVIITNVLTVAQRAQLVEYLNSVYDLIALAPLDA